MSAAVLLVSAVLLMFVAAMLLMSAAMLLVSAAMTAEFDAVRFGVLALRSRFADFAEAAAIVIRSGHHCL